MTAPITDRDVRCWRCRRAIAVVATRPWLFKCHKCNAVNGSPPAPLAVQRVPAEAV